MKETHRFVSSQAFSVYELISEQGALTAAQIGRELDVLPNAVYRLCDRLIELGVIKKSDSYPATFSAVPLSTALGWFLIAAQSDFKRTFGRGDAKMRQPAEAPTISFIKDRASLLVRTDKDVANAKQEVKFIVSGLGVPDSTVLAYRKASAKGVKIRALIQKRRTSDERLEHWQDIGVEVRQIDAIDLRLFVIDSKIAYVTSYDEGKKEQAFGVRFSYAPFAVLLGDIFEQKWLAAKS